MTGLTNQRLIGRQHAAVALVTSDRNQRHCAKLLLGDVRGGVTPQNRRTWVIVLEKNHKTMSYQETQACWELDLSGPVFIETGPGSGPVDSDLSFEEAGDPVPEFRLRAATKKPDRDEEDSHVTENLQDGPHVNNMMDENLQLVFI